MKVTAEIDFDDVWLDSYEESLSTYLKSEIDNEIKRQIKKNIMPSIANKIKLLIEERRQEFVKHAMESLEKEYGKNKKY